VLVISEAAIVIELQIHHEFHYFRGEMAGRDDRPTFGCSRAGYVSLDWCTSSFLKKSNRSVLDELNITREFLDAAWVYNAQLSQLRIFLSMTALATSIKNAPISGMTTKAQGDAPYFLVTAVMLTMAVEVAPSARPA
jgi:hypothetical protein